MNSRKPVYILLYVVSVLTLLLLLSFIFPKKGVQIGNSFNLQFPTTKEIFDIGEPKYADVTQIISQNESEVNDTASDPAPIIMDTVKIDTIRANAQKLRKRITKIEFPNNNRKLLYPAFKAFENAKENNEVVHVLHYGDSQIEGDRITSYLRYKLQKHFGGSGVGLVPVKQVYNFRFSVFQDNSENWNRKTVYGRRDTTLTHKRYGAIGSFATIKEYKDTNTAWVSFNESHFSYSNTKTFQRCRVFYSHAPEPFKADLYIDELPMSNLSLNASNKLGVIDWQLDTLVNNAAIDISCTKSPYVYGISIEGLSGVSVDNVAMRGSSGTIFTKMDQQLYAEMMKELNAKLILLQFGGNTVPAMSSSYKYYERLFLKQIEWIKEAVPDASIVVIGVADMSMKEKNYYVSYPSVEKVRNATKSAAFKAGAGYWDMYEAMGGKNSMPSWVFAKPPLATSDFVHFNVRGAKLIANMFYNALWYEYLHYRNAASSN